MTTQKKLQHMDEARLTALYESGQYAQALHAIEESGLLTALDEQPDASEHACLALLVANLYRELAHYTPAEQYYLQALAGLARTAGPQHPGYARGLVELGVLYQQLDRHAEARRLFEQARAIHEAADVPDLVAHSRCLQALADLLDELGRRREAQTCLTRARALLEQAAAPPLEMADLLLNEAWTLCRVQGLLDTVQRARRALTIYTEHKGANHPGTHHASYRLGRLLLSLCLFEEAAPLLEEAARGSLEVFGNEHPRHATALEALAMLRMCQGEPGQAEKLARQALALNVAALGDRHTKVAGTHERLGHILLSERKLTAAAESWEQALAIVRDVLGSEHPRMAEIQIDLAEIHQAMGEHHNADDELRAALHLLDSHPEDVRFEQVSACLALARLRMEAGDLDEAGALVGRACSTEEQLGADPLLQAPALLLQVRLRAEQGQHQGTARLIDQLDQALAGLPAHHPLRVEAAITRAWLLRMAGDPAGAVRLARAMTGSIEAVAGERSPWLPEALRFLADQLSLSGDFAESERVYERTLDLQQRSHGKEHPDQAVTLRELARLHLLRGNFPAAQVRFQQALEIRRNNLGEKHPDTAQSLTDLASLAQQAGDLFVAESLYRQALQICHASLGATHPDTLEGQHGLAVVLWKRGEPVAAAELLEKSLGVLGDGHLQRFRLQHTLALICHARGEPARALALLDQVRQALEKSLGTEHDGLLPVLADLATIHAGLGDHLAARELLERIGSVRAASPFPDPLGQAFDLVCLSDSYRCLDDLARAAALSHQALDTARLHLAGGNPALVGFLTHFARTCQARGGFSAARRHFREALALVVKTGGNRHPMLASVWTDLAGLEVARGRPGRATPLYAQSAELLGTVQGEDHPDHAIALRTLGLHLQTLGEFGKAEAALRRSLAITRRTAGAEHPAVAMAYRTLVELHRRRGDLAGAATACRQALDLVRRAVIPLDAAHAEHLHALAVLCRQQGQLDEAAKLLGQALEIDRTSTGEEGTGHLDSLKELALVEAARGEDASAVERLRRVLSAQDRLTSAFAFLSSGPVRDALLTTPWRVSELLLSLACRLPSAAEPAFAAVLRWKALPPARQTPGARATLRRSHPARAKELDRWFDLSLQIAQRLVRGAGSEGLQMHHDLLVRWGKERDDIEQCLSPDVPSLARLRALRAVDLAGLERALPDGATLVELVRFQPRDFAAVCAGRDGSLPAYYLGFVIHGQERGVTMLDLGPAASLERRGGPKALRALLAPHLIGRQQLVVATDGRLGRAACVTLAEPHQAVRRVSSAREMVSPLLATQPGWVSWLKSWLSCQQPSDRDEQQ
jgi:tetratricopeptide (TPR) repeat protein